jgi:Sedlin, N-terminal conserved region
MALLCLAIVGKNNEPLYVHDMASQDDETNDDDVDIFGFSEVAANDSLSFRNEFMMHASLDRLAEIAGSPSQFRNRSGSNTKWIGLLCPMEDTCIYGYTTSTNIKLLAMIADIGEPVGEAHLKALFVSVRRVTFRCDCVIHC